MTIQSKLTALVRLEPLKNRDEATAVAIETARLELERERAALIRDERIEALKLEFDLQIESFTKEIDRNVKRLQGWSTAHREGEFGTRKSITLGGHTLQFREGTGKVEFLPGVKADDALDRILALDPVTVERFVRVTPELNKQAVLSAWKASSSYQTVLSECGIAVTKTESFSFVSNRDEVPDTAPVAVGKGAA